LSRVRVHPLKRSPVDDFQTLIIFENPIEQRKANELLNRKQIEGRTLASQLIQSQENERKRLARELHDDIGQRLSLVASEVALLASEHSDTTSIFVNRLNALRDDLDNLCSDIHCMSHDLHSYKLQHLGLKSALKDLCRRLSQPNFRIDLYVDNFNEPHFEEISLCLYRVAQEALHNALKHSHASTVAVTLTRVQSMYYMTVQDSGIGFVRSASSQGLGLISMSERLKLVNGHMKLHSIPGRGTEIWIAIPDTEDMIEPSCLVSACGGVGRA
jgi:signal transduction histidine kinase